VGGGGPGAARVGGAGGALGGGVGAEEREEGGGLEDARGGDRDGRDGAADADEELGGHGAAGRRGASARGPRASVRGLERLGAPLLLSYLRPEAGGGPR